MLSACLLFVTFVADENQPTPAWVEYYEAEAKKIQVIAAEDEKPLARIPGSMQSWRNEARPGQTNGRLYVWEQNDRVAVVGTVFSYSDSRNPGTRVVARSLLRMCEDDVVAQADERIFWKPSKIGLIRGQKIVGVDVPASRAARLTLMRRIAGRFSASIVENDGTERNLRLIRTPIHRYAKTPKGDSPGEEITDGGLFVLATEGTDPEVLLLLESVRGPDGDHWTYSLGRFTQVVVRVSFDEDEVWEASRNSAGSNYATNRFASKPERLESGDK